MARGGLRTLGVGLVGFAVALAIGEARNPGSASDIVNTGVNAGVPVVQGAGVFAGESLAATEPVATGARQAMNGLGTAVGTPEPSTVETLPAPVEGE